MILVNTNSKSQKLYNRKVSIKSYSKCFWGFWGIFRGLGLSEVYQNLRFKAESYFEVDYEGMLFQLSLISENFTKSKTSSSKFTKSFYKFIFKVFWDIFRGLG